jgi:hypothetical protein
MNAIAFCVSPFAIRNSALAASMSSPAKKQC